MTDDFAVFILTHGRAENQITLNMLLSQGYSGRWYMILDDEDDTADEYIARYGKDHVIIFNKQAVINRTDTMDNFNEHRAIVYARNESYRIAKELSLRHFMMIDDDIQAIRYRYEADQCLKGKKPYGEKLDSIFQAVTIALEETGAQIIALGIAGDHIGGLNGGFKKKIKRTIRNALFCQVDRPVEFFATMNEDLTTAITLGSRGGLFFAYLPVDVIHLPPKKFAGGMTEVYNQTGEYTKFFYSVLAMPSCAQVVISKDSRVRIRVNWSDCTPKIIGEEWRKKA